MPTFTTTLAEASPGSIGLVELPFDPRATFGKVRAPVVVTVRGVSLRTTVMSYDGRFYVGFRREIRDRAGLEPGMQVQIDIVPDDAPRTIAPPADLAKGLRADGRKKAAWEALSFTQKRELAEAIGSAKKPETRAARIEKTLAMLAVKPAKPGAAKPAKKSRAK